MFSETQLEDLRKFYAKIDRIDPDGAGYAGMCKLLDGMDQPTLKQLAEARPAVKFLSKLALNRVIRAR